jgi:hypothetical protein
LRNSASVAAKQSAQDIFFMALNLAASRARIISTSTTSIGKEQITLSILSIFGRAGNTLIQFGLNMEDMLAAISLAQIRTPTIDFRNPG